MKKKVILISSVLLTLIVVISTIFIINKNNSNNETVMQDKKAINNSFLTLMLEDETGNYVKSTSNTWPSGNYAFNEELSRCENGGELRWNRETGIVNLLSNKSDACYVYFDLYNVVTITNVFATKTTNSVTLSVTIDAGENPVATYYFSMDGGKSYQESTTSSYTFSNLNDNTTYTFQVYAKDTLGYESNEEVIEVTTDAYVNPVVNSVTATNVTNNAITVSVSATAGTNNIQTYMYSINNGAYQSSSSNTHTFSGLNAGTNYNIRVYVTDTNGVDSNVYTINAETDDTILLADVCSTGTNLATCLKNYYNEAGTEMSGMYYHTSSLANSAADNSYRYAGANPNNYVCFGSDAATCPSANLYRIIGVFGSEVKLIKNTSYGEFFWNGSGESSYSSNSWNISSLNRSELNQTFLNRFSANWQEKISTHTWFVGGINSIDTPLNIYKAESFSGNYESYNSKIGLLYASDYGFSTESSNWSLAMGMTNYKNNNWLYQGNNEWTITPNSSNSENVMLISRNGNIINYLAYASASVRPTFYLTSSVQYLSGTGTSNSPIRIA